MPAYRRLISLWPCSIPNIYARMVARDKNRLRIMYPRYRRAVRETLLADLSDSTPQNVGLTGSAGTSETVSRSDHVHAHGNLVGQSLHATASSTANGFMSYADFNKLLTLPPSGAASSSINVNTVAPLYGGGMLTGSLLLTVSGASASGSGVMSSAHFITLSDIGNNYVTSSRTITTTAPIDGGGELTANRTLTLRSASAVNAGGISVAEWIRLNDLGNNYATQSLTITAGTGLLGGGSLVANRTISASFGSGSSNITRGNDVRFYNVSCIPSPSFVSGSTEMRVGAVYLMTGTVQTFRAMLGTVTGSTSTTLRLREAVSGTLFSTLIRSGTDAHVSATNLSITTASFYEIFLFGESVDTVSRCAGVSFEY